MRKLTIVVTCTDSKSLPPAEDRRVRTLPAGEVRERCAVWRSRLTTTAETRPLRTLYQGPTWSRVPHLIRAARSAGFEPRVLVASAGLGLRDLDAEAPGYAATFSRNHPDSVGATPEDTRAWWTALRETPGAGVLVSNAPGRTLLVLSTAYATALHEDLVALAKHGGEVLLVGGAVDVAGISRLPSDRRLRQSLGGTMTSLNVRMAEAWLERTVGAEFASAGTRRQWDSWATSVRHEESWDRRSLSDADVGTFLRVVTARQPGLSRTAALRQLRDSGLACEQKRFGALFAAAAAQR